MKLNPKLALTEAWGMWTKDRDLLLRIAGLFIFLPRYAVLLLVPSLKIEAGTDETAMRTAMVEWFAANGPWMLASQLIALYGTLVLQMIYLGKGRPNLGTALLESIRMLPRFLLVAVLMSLPACALGIPVIGIAAILPVLYLFGRWMLAPAEVIAERPIGAVRSLQRSFEMTRGNGLVLMGIAAIMLLAGQVASWPFIAIGDLLNGAPAANLAVKALLDALAAASLTIALLAAVLVRIAIYYQLRTVRSGT